MSIQHQKHKVIFLGCPLDADERDESVQEKLACMGRGDMAADPYNPIMEILRQEVDGSLWEELGSLPVPTWLSPVPGPREKEHIHVAGFVDFIDRDGCRTLARMLGEHVVDQIIPNIPCMLGVDHSLTGGLVERLFSHYGSRQTSLIVLDSHTDALTTAALSGAIAYDMENNPASFYDPQDPFLRGRPESYNASSFLDFLVREGIVAPEHLYILGVGDYPPKRAFQIRDPRMQDYVGCFESLKEQGATILTKKDAVNSPSRLRRVLSAIQTPYVYISIDMDVGAGKALEGVRFRDRQGLSETQLSWLAGLLRNLVTAGNTALIGMDLMEMNPRRAGPGGPVKEDKTYRIAANLVRRILFGLDEKH